jgi:glyoxylase-like metal-dependent hydrolase (beta-lactamase superfamily II)
MQIFPLSEGAFTVDKTKQFVPFDVAGDVLQERPSGSLLVEIQPFCVVTDRDVIVLDTGLGYCESDGTLQIHSNLLRQGINPLEVTKVLMSHLHKDHAGGMSRYETALKQRIPSFPSATYYVNRQELDFALSQGAPSFHTEPYSELARSSQVILTEGSGEIDGYIRFTLCGGHSPYHQVFHIEEDGATVFYGGDVAPQLRQMKSRIVAKYDHDGRLAMNLRQQWWEQAQAQHWTLLFYHDIALPVVRC